MKNIIFIAPPAAGKGTQSDLLVKKYGYTHISTGDLLRGEIAKQSEIGKNIKELMDSGNLISDEIVSTLLKNKLISVDGPFILDGYPRDLNQIDILNKILEEIDKRVDIVIYLDVPYNYLLDRVTGRLFCPKCSKSYHRTNLKPKKEWICDDCGEELISRSDDNEETFKHRYQTYIDCTSPIIEYYKNIGLLEVIDSTDIEGTFDRIEKVIK